MSLQRRSKWQQPHKAICHKFEDAVEGTRAQTDAFWESLSLPKHKPTKRKPKPAHKGSHNTIKERLKAIAYKQAEDRDEESCVVCGGTANSHHHIIKQSTRYGPQYIQRMENVVLACNVCHTEIHNNKGIKSWNQEFLEQWQQRYYPEYTAMMRELAKITGCRDQWLIDRWDQQQAIGG